MQIKNTLIASAFVGLLLAPAATFAADSLQDTREIYGRTVESIEATLAQYGIDATNVETWGDALRVDARAADGSAYTVLVDRDTLQPVANADDVASRVDLGLSTNSGWAVGDAINNPVSVGD